MGEVFKRSLAVSKTTTARSGSSVSVATAVSLNRLAAGSVIQRGILRSTPSGPRTVIGMSACRGARTSSRSAPARGWKG
jgi:hypothetical protein